MEAAGLPRHSWSTASRRLYGNLAVYSQPFICINIANRGPDSQLNSVYTFIISIHDHSLALSADFLDIFVFISRGYCTICSQI